MPEGPELRNYSDAINKFIKPDDLCLEMTIFPYSRYYSNKFLGYEFLNFPALFKSSITKGKKIILTFESLKTKKRFFIVISPLMTGVIRFSKGDYTSISMTFENNTTIYLDDVRKFAIVRGFDSEDDLNKQLSKIGPDLLSDEISLEEYKNKIRNTRIKENNIYVFLLNQKWFSGIGNYLACEILYQVRISPHRKLKDLSESDIINLYNSSLNKIKESYEANGLSIRDYFNPATEEPGTFKCLIYNQNYDPFGRSVTREKMRNKRTAYWVQSYQI